MAKRFRTVGIIIMVIGLVFAVAGGVAYFKVQDGYGSLQAFSEAQNVTLSYNDDGQLIDRGTTEGADAIMTLLTEDWAYPVVAADLDPNDPLVNSASEYMFQMATIVYHVLHGTQNVTLANDVEYNGETFAAGDYAFEVDGRYWTDFDRRHPIEGVARGQAWSGTAHGLVGELGVGTVTHSTLQMGLALAALFGAVGLTFMLSGFGLIWATREDDMDVTVPDTAEAITGRIPEATA
ncbi:MAG: hypothetical protein HKN01_00890 [Acidimicrobiia bacterium]|nr:hypothetical protein [Acidimicrobiia bacterium]NNF68299.1 hypothetical protein [Acidimicrobiia bacterium]NNK90809.1 hypothetical protein [Acidimicrobiia bacterium]